MVRECGCKKQEIYSEFFKNLFINVLTENRDVGGRIMLRYISERWVMMVGHGCNRLRIVSNGLCTVESQ
jgi:hypothetical protein